MIRQFDAFFSSISWHSGSGLLKSTVRVQDLFSSGFVCMIEGMKHDIVIALVLAVLAVPIQAAAAQDRVLADPAFLVETTSQRSVGAPVNEPAIQSPIAVPSEPAPSYFRDIPSISGRYSIGGRALLPYLGTGFSGGYSSELNRSLGGAPPREIDLGFRNQLGQSVSPNEFQLGVRIPF
jgi:hypothetical protein